MSETSIVGIGGTTRPGSSGERITRAVLAAAARRGAHTRMFGGADLQVLPHFAPERSERTSEQVHLVDAVRAADGLVICSPGYHGGVSGLVKNAIDLLEDLRDDRRSYFEGRPVGLIVVAAGWQACGMTLSALRSIVHAMRGWPTPLGITVNTVAQNLFGEGGEIIDVAMTKLIELQAAQILDFVTKPNSASQ
jgi:FMN reductase